MSYGTNTQDEYDGAPAPWMGHQPNSYNDGLPDGRGSWNVEDQVPWEDEQEVVTAVEQDAYATLVGDLISRPREDMPREPPLPYQEDGAIGFGRGQRYQKIGGLADSISPQKGSRHEGKGAPPMLPLQRIKGYGKAAPVFDADDGHLHQPVVKRGRSRTPANTRREAPRHDASPGENSTWTDVTFKEALMEMSKVPEAVICKLIQDIGADPATMSLEDFQLTTARSMSSFVRDLVVPQGEDNRLEPAPLMVKLKVWKGLNLMSEIEGGDVARSFAASGLNDEPLSGHGCSTLRSSSSAQPPEIDAGAQLATDSVSARPPPSRSSPFDETQDA